MANSSRAGLWQPLTVVIVVVAAAAAGAVYWKSRADRAPQFTTVVVARGDVVQAVTATGDIEPVLSVNVSSQISGTISKLFVDWNSPVKQGQLMAQIDPATYQANVQQAEGQLANAQANLQLVRVNTERTRELFQKSLVTRADLDQAEAQLAQADAQVKIQNASLATAKVNLSRCTLYSPIDGVVISRQVDVGNTVAVSLNAPTLFVIANDLTKMQIIAAVAEADIGSVAVGQAVNFTVDAFPSLAFRGKVSQIRNSPQTQQNVVVYQTIIDVDNPELKLRPGMTANVSIVIAEHDHVLRLPNSALRARLPEELLPKAEPAAGPAATGERGAAPGPAPAAGQDPRRAAFALLREAGFVPGNGRPTPDLIQKAQQLAKERGLDVDFSRFAGEGQRTGGAASVRTLYKLAGAAPKAEVLVPVKVKLGITDGINTEVISGLEEGEAVVTGVATAGAAPANGGRPAANPLVGGPGGFRR